MSIAVICLFSFLIGGIPFGYLVGRFVLKDDIRNHGSGNIGATNVGRVIGWKWGGFVLFLDALKGLLPTWGAAIYATEQLPASMHWDAPVAAGLTAIIGHMYPIYLRLRGGKGVATAVGVLLVLAPKSLGVAFLAFAIVVAACRIVALGSIVAALTFGGFQLYQMRQSLWETNHLSMTIFSITIPLLVIWRHRSNLRRLISGTEHPVTNANRTEVNRTDA